MLNHNISDKAHKGSNSETTPSLNKNVAGWSSPVARQAHNLKVVGSNPTPATKYIHKYQHLIATSGWLSAFGPNRAGSTLEASGAEQGCGEKATLARCMERQSPRKNHQMHTGREEGI